MRSHYDVVIIGGGPAGLSAADELAGCGKTVLVVERNEQIGPKICAGGLPARITELEVPLELADKQFSSIKAHIANKTYNLTLPTVILTSIDRAKFGRFLLEKALARGTEVITGVGVKSIRQDHVMLDGQAVGYAYLIGADGSASVTRRWLGLKTEKVGLTVQYVVPIEFVDFELFFDAHTFGSGFGWILPHRGSTVIGMGRDKREIGDGGLKADCRRLCQSMGVDLADAVEQSWLINYDYRGWRYGKVFLVGDAGGFASGLTGEGIYFAMVSGREAARKIVDPNYSCPELQRILRKKRNQERLLRLMQINTGMLNAYYRVLLSVAESRWFTRRFLDFFL